MTAGTGNVTVGINHAAGASNTVSAGMAKGLLDFVVHRGADRAALMSASGLDATALEHEDARVSFSQYVALYDAGEALCGDPALALHFGEAMAPMDLLVVCHVGSACATMGGALAAINRYGRLSVDVDTVDGGDPFQVEKSAAGTWLVDATVYPGNVSQLTETSFTRLIAGTRQLTDREFVRAVHFVRAAPAHRKEYEQVFRAPVAFGQPRNAMLLDPDWLELPIGVGSPYAGAVFEAHASALLSQLEPASPYRRAVEESVRTRLGSGVVTMRYIARQLGVSRQTLYRQLRLERTTFEEILDGVRRQIATQLLREGISIGETAHRLGFSDRSAFSRAFKRWTGRSPRSAE
jgi:AraC-like DNA-binding protein